MTKPKNLILLLLLFIVVGIAAVSTNVIINGTTQLASNPDDFNVYFSNVKVNGVQDLSLVQSETSLVFNGEFSAVGDKKEITYDVTNASKNYDADIDITCTPSTTYLTITNSFDTSTNLAATSTRTGVLSITLSKSYTGADLTEDISCTITASAVERTSQGTSNVASPLGSNIVIGQEITIGEEKFNVISVDNDTVTMLAQQNISGNAPYKQTSDISLIEFSDSVGWEYTPGPKEIDLELWSPNIYQILDGYQKRLFEEYNIDSETSLITVRQLMGLNCVVDDTYFDGFDCVDSNHYEWLVKEQVWWTRSADASFNGNVFGVLPNGGSISINSNSESSIRPTITISKETALALIKYKTYAIGEEISIGDENFNVISQTPTTVTMLAQYSLGTDYKQSATEAFYEFSDSDGW